MMRKYTEFHSLAERRRKKKNTKQQFPNEIDMYFCVKIYRSFDDGIAHQYEMRRKIRKTARHANKNTVRERKNKEENKKSGKQDIKTICQGFMMNHESIAV